MQNYILRLILFCLALTCRNITWADSVLTGRTITTADGLPSNLVNDMVQDHQGFIWMATSNGLCRYDGYSFLNFPVVGTGKGQFAGSVGTLHLDEDNALLWMRTATFGYACYDLKKKVFLEFTNDCDPQKTFSRFFETDNGICMYEAGVGIRKVIYDKGHFVCTDYTKENGALPAAKVKRVIIDSRKHMWVMTDQGLLWENKEGKLQYLRKTGDFMVGNRWKNYCLFLTRDSHILIFNEDGRLVRDISLHSIYSDMGGVNGNIVWQDKWLVMTRTAVVTLKMADLTVEQDPKIQMDYGIPLDNMNGNHWVSDRHGTLWLFPQKGEVRNFQLLDLSVISIDRKRNFSTIQGLDGCFYIATYGNGLFVYHPDNGRMEHYSAYDKHALLANNYLINIHVDNSGNIWVGQENAGIVCLTKKEKPDVEYNLPEPNQRGSKNNYVTSFRQEDDGDITVGTRSNNIYRFHLRENSIVGAGSDPINKNCTDSVVDKSGRQWIGTWEQGLRMRMRNAQGQEIRKNFITANITEGRINDLAIDHDDRLWIASYNGLYMTDLNNKEITDDNIIYFGEAYQSLSSHINCLLPSSDGSLWVGGQGTGAIQCRMDKGGRLSLKVISTTQGLADNDVKSMAEDKYGQIWVGTEDGISQIAPGSGRVANHKIGTTLLNSLYTENSALTLDDGRLIFGTHDGIAIITPEEIKDTMQIVRKAFITNIDINGKSIIHEDQYKELRNIDSKISLAHHENSLVIYFSSFDYANIDQAMYQFYLEGIDKEWREPTTQHSIEYSGLRPGKYVFHLRTSEDSEETTLTITIRQPWYNTWWAWLIYLLIIGVVGWIFFRHKREQFRLRQQMEIEKEVSEFRANFFTQVAHEFRTPLAIISGAVDKMSDGAPSRKTIQLTQRGVKRLSTLVNQLMEFRKVQTGNLRLQVEQGDIIGFVRDICQDFWHVAEQKEQSLTFTPFAKKHIMLFDRHIVDTIVYNLISNAVKYTPQGGTITVRMKKDDGQIEMVIDDSGKGIDKERQTMLFHPFMHGYASQGGMGIGLYTAHRMAQTHKGTLSYKPSETLGGSAFTLILPADDSIYGPDDYGQTKTAVKTEERVGQADQVIREMLPQALNDKRVAIIEDEPDMLEQIKAEMAVYFHVSGYTDGQSGLEGIHEERPSLLICDIMLPDTNGYEVVKRMKGDEALKDIPVIMLTALDDERHHIKGYEAGADDYMTKPCNYRILIARAIQLIRWKEERESVSERPEGSTERLPEKSTILTSQADKRFLERVNLLIAQHLSNPDYTIDQMAETMKMGRTKFYGKVKELTGLSPNKLFMSERMRKAAVLLDEGELNISEIGFRVGILDPSYFNRCFKQHFGVTPGQYQKNK